MGLPLQEVQREVQNMEEKGQAGQAHLKAGLSLPTGQQALRGSEQMLKLEPMVAVTAWQVRRGL